MTPLGDIVARQIALTGPMPLSDYMALCLSHPRHGVYAAGDPLGAGGHFTTAPEISQMFGELLGLALGQAWIDQGRPEGAILAELGPGRGTLMRDALRALKAAPGFPGRVHLVETSAPLRAAQAEAVPDATWHRAVADLPEAPLFLVANEFFDALPVRQFRREARGWREVVVGLDGTRLTFGLAALTEIEALAHRRADTSEGEIVEICPALTGIAAEIGRRIAAHGGAALIVDYGGWRSRGDTLQALRRHERVDPLAAPGTADLTAHVDFEALARAAAPAAHTPLAAQGAVLERLGITVRAQALAARRAGPDRQAQIAAHRRLTHPAEMGHLFRVIGLHPAEAPPPPGFA